MKSSLNVLASPTPARLILASVAMLGWIELSPQPFGNVAVIFPPWMSAADGIRRATAAGSSIVRYGRYPFILVVHPTHQAFVSRAMTYGALLVVDAKNTLGCSPRAAN